VTFIYIYMLITYLNQIYPFITLLSSLPCFLEQFWQVSLFYFRTLTQNISIVFALLHSLHLSISLPLVSTFFFFFFFNKKTVQEIFVLVSQTYIYCTLIRYPPHYLIFLYCPDPCYSTVFSAFHYASFICTCIVFQYCPLLSFSL
jgi:hypothetical protein